MPLTYRTGVFMALNATRVLSLIALLLVFASSIFVLVTDIEAVNAYQSAKQTGNSTSQDSEYIENSTVPNQPAGVFWAVVNRLLIMFQAIVLILSELGWPSVFFERFFPVLGPEFGLGALGIFQGLIGAAILSHHVDDFSLVSAFFLFSIGCLNMLLGLIFRESAKAKRSIKVWRAETEDVLPTVRDSRPVFTSAAPSFMTEHEKADDGAASEFGTLRSENAHPGYGFGRQGEKHAGLKGFLLTKPTESLPRYATGPTSVAGSRPGSTPPSFQSSGTAL